MRSSRSPSPALITVSDGNESGMSNTSPPAWHDNTLELQSQGVASTKAQEVFRSGGWWRPSSQNSGELTVCFATAEESETPEKKEETAAKESETPEKKEEITAKESDTPETEKEDSPTATAKPKAKPKPKVEEKHPYYEWASKPEAGSNGKAPAAYYK